MDAEPGRARRPASVVVTTTAARAVRSGAIWGALFGLLVFNEARGYHTNFATTASRQQFAAAFGGNGALAAVTGPPRQLDTIQGFVAWRMFGLLIVVGAVWGLLTATRLLRGEEDAGRWEVLLAGRTNRRRATGQALAGLAAGVGVLWALTAVFTAAAGLSPSVGFPVSASLFYATACTASAAVFVAVGAFTSQLGRTRREANGLAGAALAVAFVIRMFADGVSGWGWLRWATPLGWVENLQPLTGSQPLALVPLVALVALAATGAVALAGRRDVGAGVLTRHEVVAERTGLLDGPTGLAARLERGVALAWVGGLALLALIFGIVARSAAEANLGDRAMEQAVSRLGGNQSGAAAWIGYEFVYLAALLAFAAAGQVGAMRAEEADGHLDHLVARAVSRRRWVAGRVGLAAAFVVVAGLATGFGAWLGLTGHHDAVGFGDLVGAGITIAAPALLVLGLGTLLFGVAPRAATALLYALVLWSFVIQIIGSTITTNHWLVDTAVFSHVGPVPAAPLDWVAIAWLTGLGVVAVVAGMAAFDRRDLASD